METKLYSSDNDQASPPSQCQWGPQPDSEGSRGQVRQQGRFK